MEPGDLYKWNGKQAPDAELFAVASDPSGRIKWEKSVKFRGDDFFIVVKVGAVTDITVFCPRNGSYATLNAVNVRKL